MLSRYLAEEGGSDTISLCSEKIPKRLMQTSVRFVRGMGNGMGEGEEKGGRRKVIKQEGDEKG